MALSVNWVELGVRDGGSPADVYFDDNRQTARRVIRVAWADQAQALEEILGYSAYVGSVSGSGYLSREIPEQHPIHTQLWAVDARLREGQKWTGNETDVDGYRNKFKYAVIEITYQAVNWYNLIDGDPDLGGSEKNRGVEYWDEWSDGSVTIPGGTMKWATGAPAQGQPVPIGASKIEGHKAIHLKWREIPYLHAPYAVIDGLIGKVNKATFTLDGKSWAAGTLLVKSPRTTYRYQSNGTFVVDLEYILDYFSKGHNNLLYSANNSAAGYYQINRTASAHTIHTAGSIPDGACLYDEGDLETLFQVVA